MEYKWFYRDGRQFVVEVDGDHVDLLGPFESAAAAGLAIKQRPKIKIEPVAGLPDKLRPRTLYEPPK